MSKHALVMERESQKIGGLTLASYVIGFVFSLVFTLTAYVMAVHHLLANHTLIGFLACLAILQFILQAVFFLHLSIERRPRWKLAVFLFMIMVVLILVFGSIWIMSNLNQRMTPGQMNNYMTSQDAL
jgi:cytochrome o ubiquinol oxidase operon protein cyoD